MDNVPNCDNYFNITSSQTCISYKHYKIKIQDAAEITPTFQKGITNNGTKSHQKLFIFQMSISKRFFTLGFKNYIVQMVAVTADTHLEPFFLNGLL
jgi:hypothetical protein